MVSVSVIIATLKPRDEIEAIHALEGHAFDDYEVIVCDESPVTRARNEGIKLAQSDKLVFLDDDSLPRRGYLSKARSVLETETAYAGRTVHPYDDIFARHFTDHYDWGDDPCYVDRFWGCNAGFRREVFQTVGGWDEQMGWGHEEKELADRVTAEFDIRYEPDLVVEHPYASSISDYWRKQYKLERKTPYYWSKRGVSPSQQVLWTLGDVVNPLEYVRRTPTATVVQAGGTVAKTAGRIKGLYAEFRSRNRAGEGVPKTDMTADPPQDASHE